MDTNTRVLQFPGERCVNCGVALSLINTPTQCPQCSHPVFCTVCREHFEAEDIIVTLRTTEGVKHVHTDGCADLVDPAIILAQVGSWGNAPYARASDPPLNIIERRRVPPPADGDLGAYGYSAPEPEPPTPDMVQRLEENLPPGVRAYLKDMGLL